MRKVVKGNVRAAALFGRLRELAARSQKFRDAISALSQEPPVPIATIRESMRVEIFEEVLLPLLSNFDCMAALIKEISSLLQKDGRAYSEYGDTLGRIKTAWEQIDADWYRVVAARSLDCSRQLARISTALDSITYDCCEITIPSRIKEHLELLPIGGTLDFRGAYDKELSAEEGRKRFLKYLHFYPTFIDGLIDIDNEIITRAAPPGWRRISTLFFAALFALAGFALIFIALWFGDFAKLAEWPFKSEHSREYYLTYAFLLIGSISHVVINLLKQDRSASSSSQILSDWILRIHVRETAFYISALSLCFGSLAVPFLFVKGISWQAAFFVGYSYDSFIDLFLKRFEKVVANSLEENTVDKVDKASPLTPARQHERSPS